MKKIFSLVFCIILLLSNEPSLFAAENIGNILNAEENRVDFYVSLEGNDNNPGTIDRPFKSLEKAKAAIRDFKKKSPSSGTAITVWIRGGIYDLENTFSLYEEDSGQKDNPIVYSAYPGEEVRITGAVHLENEIFSPVTANDAVYGRLNASAKGNVFKVDIFNVVSFGTLKKRGMTLGGSSGLELFYNGEPMQLSRWPDVGENSENEGVKDGFALVQNATSESEFNYKGNRPDIWLNSEDIWYHGIWNYLWADFHVQNADINGKTNTIKLKEKPQSYGIISGAPFYALNILEEITVPGEWYLDRTTGYLYFWPPDGITANEIRASSLDKLISLNKASWIRFENITFEMVRDTVVSVSGSSDDLFYNCKIRNSGGYGVIIDGKNNGMYQCKIYYTGNSAVTLKGGDRVNLVSAGNFVRNCDIHDFGRWSWMYQAGVYLDKGVENIVANNNIYNSPHLAIWFKGNNHIIEYNNIHDVCQYTDDAGAIYSGRDWGWRGNIIRYNFIHDIKTKLGNIKKIECINGIYLDGCLSGTYIYGNTLYRIAGCGVVIGGGRDNIVRNNALSHCREALAANQWADYLSSEDINRANGWNLLGNIEKDGIKYREEPWASAYPSLAAIPDNMKQVVGSHWAYPEGNVFSKNAGYANGKWLRESRNAFDSFADITNNAEYSSSIFVSEGALDLRINNSVVKISNFAYIPFEKVGSSVKTNIVSLPETIQIAGNLKLPSATVDLPEENIPAAAAKVQKPAGVPQRTFYLPGAFMIMLLVMSVYWLYKNRLDLRNKTR